jgi:macrolide-specific efflux system membrane fusion protein
LVKEGDKLKAGQTVAWMSSTERAALLDAARARGPEEITYWQEVYKPTPLISPIDGEVIVSTDQPGQTITASDAVIVLSDHLIVQAQVDETDIGKVSIGQDVSISLDAYPQIKVNGKIVHIYYESTTVNNVTIYKVDILPDEVPAVFRSGMSATVNIIENSRTGVLTVPAEAVKWDKDGAYVLVMDFSGKNPVKRKIEVGLADDKNAEVISGLTENDKVLLATQKYAASGSTKTGTNPFMPAPRKK